MAPPKKALAAKAATAADAASFFQRGKKPTTAQRIIANKKPSASPSSAKTPTTAAASLQKQEQSSPTDEDDIKSSSSSDIDYNDDSNNKVDEIDDSWSDGNDDTDVLQPPATKLKSGPTPSTTSTLTSPVPPYKLFTEIKDLPPSSTRRAKAKTVLSIETKEGIHQDDVSAVEKTLRQFDLASKYGPCIDLTRLERWERAYKL
ncbi:hypothetical protein BX616_008365, partial [Lobosporangium transversale]